jgi:hypothetical protein
VFHSTQSCLVLHPGSSVLPSDPSIANPNVSCLLVFLDDIFEMLLIV